MVTASELDFVKKEECDRDIITIAFYPTGGFGDYIISSKLLDELLLTVPCRIDVYCENMVFGQAVYGSRPDTRILPYDSLYGNRFLYDVVLCVEHFVHVWNYNAHHVAKICPEFADQVRALGLSIKRIKPEIEQQCYREALHFYRSSFLGVNRWTELRCGNVFRIPDQYTYVDLKPEYLERVRELGLGSRYITINRGADSMGRSATQTKVWPQEYYEELIPMFKREFPEYQVVQLGTKHNAGIKGADAVVLGESMEVTKWILRNSMLHIDCEGGLVHLAVQMATKCVVLFGPTPYHTYAYPANVNLVSDKCSNCMGTHPEWAFSCYRNLKEPECMYSLTADYVMQHIRDYLNRRSGGQAESGAGAGQAGNGGSGIYQEGNKKAATERAGNSKIADYRKLYEECKKKNPYLTMNEGNAEFYRSILECARNMPKASKIAVIRPGRDFIGWHLNKTGFEVVEFDPCWGFSGELGDVGFNRFTALCIRSGMDMRLGDEYNIPYAPGAFDMVIRFPAADATDRTDAANAKDRADALDGLARPERETERILKENGILVRADGRCAG